MYTSVNKLVTFTCFYGVTSCHFLFEVTVARPDINKIRIQYAAQNSNPRIGYYIST